MLIREIERFLARTGLSAASFGRRAVADPRLVFDLRKGREPRKRMRLRLEHFMNTFGESRDAG